MQSDALNVGDVVPDEFNDAKVHVQL
ncbi:MAG: hypothetical protein QOF20_2290, partial [Acidimicrobiaceae bacterium]|nr:hypothetical protein [Acidimicrobiaceae bacterium]